MKLGILTGGSDCQGLNAAIRSVVRSTLVEKDAEIVGFLQGWKGLVENLFIPLTMKDVSGILPIGGTILGTSRANPRKLQDGFSRIEANLKQNNVDALIVLGGYDTQGVALELHKRGFPVVGIPATMDNDVGCTDYSIGFFSAVNVVADAVDKLHSTASSHHRVMILEVMGRYSGWVALYGGIAGGADWIVIPEVQTNLSDIINHLKNRRKLGKYFSIIVVAEGATMHEIPVADVTEKDEFGHIRLDRRSVGAKVGAQVEKMTGFETRVTVLGHLQRGGSPAMFDRVLAARLGYKAVEMVANREFGKMATFAGNRVESESILRVVKESPKNVSIDLYDIARIFY